ncbi:MAG TPA: type II toxin-antitoxin system RelE/ParE family toxin, partial [Rhodospirillaceae bacterium]|nr:type II toxin-antitoxin system RelE/ParE family toxin [Rhodospirillaceae bacterium]
KTAALGLADFPERGRLRNDGAREIAIIPPYVIVYDATPHRVTILRVWHGAQNREG